MKLKISYTLKSGVNGEIPIIANLNFGYKEFDVLKKVLIYKPMRYYTGVKVEKYEWNNELKQPHSKNKLKDHVAVEEKIIDIFNYLKMRNEVTPENFKRELDVKLKGKDDTKIISRVRLVDFINNEILKSTSLKPASKKSYKGLSNKLVEFEKKLGKPLYSNELNEDIYKMFMEEMKDQLGRINSVWTVQKVFKATLYEISRRYKIKLFDPTQELSVKDRIQYSSTDSIYLNYEQIKVIIEHEPSTESLKNTKLILLTLLFTGCRESDVYKILPDHTYDKNGIIFQYAHYFSQKTDAEIIVPILKPLADAFEQNGGKPAYQISQQKFNEYVKILIEECELSDEVTVTFIDSTGKKQFQTKKLYDFVSSHIGRRSFVTNLINHIPITILTKITGHTLKDKSIIFGYNKISLLDNAVLFRKQLKQAVDDNSDHFLFKLV